MRYFFRSRIPEPKSVLMVESGSRAVLEKARARMRDIFPQACFDLCTCYPGAPSGDGFQNVLRVTEAPGLSGKLRMLRAIRRRRPAIMAVLFTGESIMLPWKLALLSAIPAKVLVVNENGDFFWLDWANRSTLRQFLGSRVGVDGAELLRAFCRTLVFPFSLLFLAGYALVAYSTRWTRLLLGTRGTRR